MKVTTENGRQFVNDFFVYTVRVPSLAFGTQFTTSLNIEADSSFICVKQAYFASIANATQTEDTRVVPLIDISITDSGSGRILQNIAAPIDSVAGRGELPLVLPIPREYKASSSISVTFSNYSAATTYSNVTFTMIGYKKFMLGS